MCLDCVYNTPVLLRRLMLAAGFREEDLDFGELEADMSEQKKTPAGTPYDLDLGDGHYLRWAEADGELLAGVLIHTHTGDQPPAAVDGECILTFGLRHSKTAAENPEEPRWLLTGHRETPTLSPSFRCHCGDHGYVREGRWERA